jgi:hypothetical protein
LSQNGLVETAEAQPAKLIEVQMAVGFGHNPARAELASAVSARRHERD